MMLGSRLRIEASLSLSELSKLTIVIKLSDGTILGSGTSSFQAKSAAADMEVVHVTSLGLFEGEITIQIPAKQLRDVVPDGNIVTLKISNGALLVWSVIPVLEKLLSQLGLGETRGSRVT